MAYSNTQHGQPTLIHEGPSANVPLQVRAGVAGVLGQAINVRNRPTKHKRFGFSTSEDAVTWTVFSFLQGHHQLELPQIYRSLFNISSAQPPTLLLWGVPVPGSAQGDAVRDALVNVCRGLGEGSNSLSEPDVVLDFGGDGLVIVEVKYRSGNDDKPTANWDPYLSQVGAFKDPGLARESRRYELVRNWRIGHALAQTRPFVFANLALGKNLASDARLPDFERSLATSSNRRFLPLPWSEFLSAAEQVIGTYPQWMGDYLKHRELR